MRRKIDIGRSGRSWQFAALLLVGASASVPAHSLAHESIPTRPASSLADQPGANAAPMLAGSERYRAEKCAGDYVCDEEGSWNIGSEPQLPRRLTPPDRTTTADGNEPRTPHQQR